MKKTFLVLSAALIAANIHAYDASPAIVPNGSVSAYTKTDFTITEKFGDYYRSPKAKYVHVFNASGRQVETSELSVKEALVDKITYTYDAAGNLTSTVCTDADGKVMWKILAVYDAKGNKTEESEFNAGDVLSNKSIWKLTPGKQSEESYYNSEGALLGKTITKFDDQGRTAEVLQYFAAGSLDEKRIYTYNDAGKLSETAYIDAAGVQTKKVVFRFDASYAITEEQTYNSANKLVQRIIYKYDEAGNVIKATTYSVAEKFGGTVNELTGICEYAYQYGSAPAVVPAPAVPVTTPRTINTVNAAGGAVNSK